MMRSKIFFSVFIASFFIVLPSLVSAQSWSNPTALPPNNNTAAPLNVSSLVQAKGTVAIPKTPALGSLFIQGDFLSNTLNTNSLFVNGNAAATQFCLGGICIKSWPSPNSGSVTPPVVASGTTIPEGGNKSCSTLFGFSVVKEDSSGMGTFEVEARTLSSPYPGQWDNAAEDNVYVYLNDVGYAQISCENGCTGGWSNARLLAVKCK